MKTLKTPARIVRRRALLEFLGGRCSCQGVDCYHDGPCPVDDERCLQLDHIDGHGADDRRRLGLRNVVDYYSQHIDEAREKLQLLCANCNWVKRMANHETAGTGRGYHSAGAEMTIVDRLKACPEFATVRDELEALLAQDGIDADPHLVGWLRERGLYRNHRITLAFSLAKAWAAQSYYNDSSDSLSRFLQERLITIETAKHGLVKIRDVLPDKGGSDAKS